MGKLMVRKKILTVILILAAISFTSCNNKNDEKAEWLFGKKAASVVQDDGWVYTFSYTYDKGELNDDGLIPYHFMGVNLRYRYNDAYTTELTVNENGKTVTKTVPKTIQILGESDSLGIKNDMAEIAEILKYEGGNVTDEELLNLTADDLSFEEFDENIFIELIHTALNGEAHEEGNYDYLPSYALLSEPEYLNNYKFQIGFISTMGCIDVVFIDVLYRTGSGYNDYEQLSDLIETGNTTDEQKQAYKLIEEISHGIEENNDLMFDSKKNKNQTIADIDFSRLYDFLNDIEENDFFKYVIEPS